MSEGVEIESFHDIVLRRFKRNKLGVLGAGIVSAVVVIGLLAPLISPYDPWYIQLGSRLQPPNHNHWLGTDVLGRDVLSRMIWGCQMAIFFGAGVAIISTLIGTAIGALAGYFRGILDGILMRMTEFLLVIPSYFIYLLVMSALHQRDWRILMVTMGLLMWPTLARVVRSEYLSLRERDYVKAARALGVSDIRIIFRHILPNAIAPIIVTTTMNTALAILLEASLSFLGVGDPTVASWGGMLTQAKDHIYTAWWLATFPGIAIFLTVMGFNMVGDGLRDALDPRLA
ncbi:MAG: ABC transporter permease [Desulfobacterales bacterium]|nr:ABC transporter permease [Desulfobacterales bacterium]